MMMTMKVMVVVVTPPLNVVVVFIVNVVVNVVVNSPSQVQDVAVEMLEDVVEVDGLMTIAMMTN